MTSPASLPMTPTRRRALTLTLMVAVLALMPHAAFAADAGDIFGDLDSSVGRAKLFINAGLGVVYLAIIIFTGLKLAGDEDKKWKVAMNAIGSIAVLGGVHAYAISKIGSGS